MQDQGLIKPGSLPPVNINSVESMLYHISSDEITIDLDDSGKNKMGNIKEEKEEKEEKGYKENCMLSEEKEKPYPEQKTIIPSETNPDELAKMPENPGSERLTYQRTLASSTLWKSYKSEKDNSDKYKNNDVIIEAKEIKQSDLDSMPDNPCSPMMRHRRTLSNDHGWLSFEIKK